MKLQTYRRKRDFSKTTEPAGESGKTRRQGKLSFVVQKHAARRLHYDLRLELDGVLKSWAVPKGPSLNPADKHLAVQVEDHPLEYATFEGTIPQGEYGGGEVIVWDRGAWSPEGDPRAGLAAGKLSFSLEGEKLRGGWSLVRLRERETGKTTGKTNWLLMKRRDAFADAKFDIVSARPESVVSKRVLKETNPKESKKPSSARPARGNRRRTTASSEAPAPDMLAGLPGAKRTALPATARPQLATLAGAPPEGEQWGHEIKFDGYRMLATLRGGKVRLHTRNRQDWTARYTAIAEALASLPVADALIDGEVVALTPAGVSNFQLLQSATNDPASAPLAYYAFDLLYLNGFDLRNCALEVRKRRLESLLPAGDPRLRYSEHLQTSGPAFLEQACRLGLEGIISKRLDRPHVSGRSSDWLKSKCHGEEELVVGGFTISEKMPKGFGALLVGYYEGERLIYAGRVGTGFSSRAMRELRGRFDKLRQKDSPFHEFPTRRSDSKLRFVRPELVAQIRFSEWTREGVLRHPAFLGLREDKTAAEVTRPASLVGKQSSAAPAVKRAPAAPVAKQMPTRPENLSVRLTNPERVLYPGTGLTKLGLAHYYAQIAPWMLPHVVDRPLSLVRCPKGQTGSCFFQKHAGAGMLAELGRLTIEEKKGPGEYVYLKSAAELVSLVQISVLEIHLWGALRDRPDRPDRLVFDLDPDVDVPWNRVVEGAFRIREMLAVRGLESFVKTTGGKGLHVVAPLAPRRRDWSAAKQFSKSIADELSSADPKQYTSKMAKASRRGKIFVDYLRNDFGSTAVAPYSTRRHPQATVAMPVEWEELGSIRSDTFTTANAMEHVSARRRDPWEEIAQWKQTF